jgi:diguanylate cyclase (GGDEF)-like protein
MNGQASIPTHPAQALRSDADAHQVGPTQSTSGRPARAVRFTLLGTAAAVAIATASSWASHRAPFFVGALAASIGSVLARTLPRGRIAASLVVLPGLTLMQANSGGAASGYSVLLVVGTIALGLEASDRELLATTVILGLCCFGPMLVIGSPAYPVRWGNAALLFTVGAATLATLRAIAREAQVLTRRLTQEAMLDDLTGLFNRRGWRQMGPRELARSSRAGTPTALLALDLDDLKHINDRRGHREGDRVLHETAARMRATLRAGDVIARLGGDEFVALLTDSTLDGTLTAIERLRAATPPDAAFSAGVAIWDRAEALQDLLNRSDQALYAAKAAGGGRTEVAPVAGGSFGPPSAASMGPIHPVRT